MSTLWVAIPIAVVVLAVAMLCVRQLRAQSSPDGEKSFSPPTLGGKQFWADELFFHQWRIQRNVLDGGYRLLDENNYRHAAGTFQQCRDKLEEIKVQQNLAPMKGKAVIVLHGLTRSRSSMNKLCKYLAEEGGYSVFNVSYPSTRQGIAEHAADLRRIIENLDGIEEINFVGHSMGNIIVRAYLAGECESDKTTDEKTTESKSPDRRIRRIVMLAPPNHGSRMATALKDNWLFRAINGRPGQELGTESQCMHGKLPAPAIEFGIIAGGRRGRFGHEESGERESPESKGESRGYNPLLPGDNDGTVTVAETRLAGARDFVVLPVLHSFIMDDKRAREYTLRFIQHGFFISEKDRCPIEAVGQPVETDPHN